MVLNRDFKEFIESLNKNRVRYLIVGGYAVAFHGYPRYTKDMDIWIWLDPENADRLVKALDDFGFASLGLQKDDFLTPGEVIQLGYPPNRIDLITSLEGVNFENCYASKLEISMDDVPVNFIDLKNLRKNKKAAGRPQDLADLSNLRQQ